VLTIVASLLLYAFILALLAAGVWLIAYDFPRVTIVPGVLLVWLAVAIRPRFGRLDPYATRISRAEAPTLFGLVVRVADAIGAPKPHLVVLDNHFNASAGAVGPLRKRVLVIGLPLWVVLPPQQRVAVLGHELGHFVNGDVRRGLLVQPAYTTLGMLSGLLRPTGVSPYSGLFERIGELLAHLVLAILSRAAWVGQLVLTALGMRDAQRAEYLADEMAAGVAGSPAAIALFDTTIGLDSIVFGVRRAARTGGETEAWRAAADEGRQAVALELPVLRQLSIRDETSLFASHPPTALRARMVESRPAQTASVGLSQAESGQIDNELAPYVAEARKDVGSEE
jgi:Zn-dependent protease with chaperone function